VIWFVLCAKNKKRPRTPHLVPRVACHERSESQVLWRCTVPAIRCAHGGLPFFGGEHGFVLADVSCGWDVFLTLNLLERRGNDLLIRCIDVLRDLVPRVACHERTSYPA
jgi:hypothetical protein